jgi:hypothetical protein
MDKFWMTLSSDSPCEFNQENKCSKFRVHLGKVIGLNGKYEVALCEIFYPATLCNIRANDCFVTKDVNVHVNKSEMKVLECTFRNENNEQICKADFTGVDFHHHSSKHCLPTRYYHTTEEFLDDFNTQMSNFFRCELEAKTQKINLNCLPVGNENEIIYYVLSPTLESILGFTKGIVFKPGNIYTSATKCDLRKGLPFMLNVCSDLVAEQIINNGHDKVLRSLFISPEKYTHGFQKKETFTKLFFLPVVKQKIEYVDIYINEQLQNEASFSHGTLKVLLLCRRVGNE